MNFKRGRGKKQRCGCLLCKPWKAPGKRRLSPAEQRVDASTADQMVCAEDALDAQKRRCGSGEYICDDCLELNVVIEEFGSSPPRLLSRTLGEVFPGGLQGVLLVAREA